MMRQRNYTRVSEHCPGVGHEQQEYYDIEGNHMKTETESLFQFLLKQKSLTFTCPISFPTLFVKQSI